MYRFIVLFLFLYIWNWCLSLTCLICLFMFAVLFSDLIRLIFKIASYCFDKTSVLYNKDSNLNTKMFFVNYNLSLALEANTIKKC